MALYRIMRSLHHGGNRIERNTVQSLHWDRARLDKLLELGLIARVSPPPLTELPAWKARAGKLATHDILDAEQFLETDDALLAKYLRVRPDTVKRLKIDVTRWLQPEQTKGCCGG